VVAQRAEHPNRAGQEVAEQLDAVPALLVRVVLPAPRKVGVHDHQGPDPGVQLGRRVQGHAVQPVVHLRKRLGDERHLEVEVAPQPHRVVAEADHDPVAAGEGQPVVVRRLLESLRTQYRGHVVPQEDVELRHARSVRRVRAPPGPARRPFTRREVSPRAAG
jgi:hypothetical protein